MSGQRITPGTPVYDPRLFTPEQWMHIQEIVAAAVAQAILNTRRRSKRSL